MKLANWEATIAEIAAESNLQPTESGQYKTLVAWRAKLEQAPASLQPFQIDEIVREVRKRLIPPTPPPPARLSAAQRAQSWLSRK